MAELAIIIFLLTANGVFAMAEIALVSAKKSRLQALADAGKPGAELALSLASHPERFLSTVQIGITVVGVLAGAFGGSSLAERLTPVIQRIPGIAPTAAPEISFGLVVAGIAYLSLVIGELVPKGLALRNPEVIACAMARPMSGIARASRPLVWILEQSTKLVMKLFGGSERGPDGPTREEVSVLIREGVVTGVLDEDESEMVEGVLDLKELRAEEVMQPKPKVVFLSAAETVASVRPIVLEAALDVFPIVAGNRDQVLGTISLRELFSVNDPHASLSALARPPVFVPENQPALSLLDLLRSAPHNAALVIDEFGTVRGLVRLLDLLEEVVGDLPRLSTDPAPPALRETKPGTWLADGGADIDSVTDAIPGLEALVEAEDDPFQTLGGFIVHRMNRLPVEGESFSEGGFRFEIIDMDQHRIDKVLIQLMPENAAPEAAAPAAAD